jgi:hypothetical protein
MFSGNSASEGGGMYNDESSPMVTDCTFSGNTTGVGGGMCNDNVSNPTVTNCTFINNLANSHGGGMWNRDGSQPTVTLCIFDGNSAAQLGGGMCSAFSSHATVINCAFMGNTAASGGAITNLCSSDPTITNSTLIANTATGSVYGGAMLNDCDAHPTVTNCIVWNNGQDQIRDWDGSSTTVRFSDVGGGWPGTGNIDANPMLADEHGRLLAASPCIDAGDNTAVPESVTTDLDGNPRFRDDSGTPDTGNGDPPIVDMGAYEFQRTSPACLWDCGDPSDGQVSVLDFLAMLGQWGRAGRCDFDGGGVSVTDFLVMLAHWGPCPVK